MKDIDKMTPIEICKYLNIGSYHRLPVIMKSNKSFEIHYSIDNKYFTKGQLKLKEAVKIMKKLK